MKLSVHVKRVEIIPPSIGWFSTGQLEIECSDSVSFRVKDTAVARRTYPIGRVVSITVTPGGGS